jgi:hypothetical protein
VRLVVARAHVHDCCEVASFKQANATMKLDTVGDGGNQETHKKRKISSWLISLTPAVAKVKTVQDSSRNPM